MKQKNYDTILGLVFFGTLIGLGFITIVLSDFAIGAEWHRVRLFSDDIGYLRRGDPVLLYGMAAGKVESIERLDELRQATMPLAYNGEARGEVLCTVALVIKMDVDLVADLRADYRILIEDRGLLGGKLIRIEVGESPDPVSPDVDLIAEAPPSILQATGAIIEENRASIQSAIQDMAEIADKANAGVGAVGLLISDKATREQLSQIIADFQDLGRSLANGEGSLGKLISDSAPFDDFKVLASDLREMTDRVQRGEGNLGRLIYDDAVYEEFRAIVSDAKQGLAGVWEGEGTLGKLIKDDAIYNDANALVTDLREMADTALNGEGTIAMLLNNSDLHDNANTMVTDISDLVDSLSDGDGLFAMLLNDQKLADDFRDILAQALGAIEDARETTPVTSLGSFLFGTF